MNKTPRALTALLALAGIGVAGYLTWVHHELKLNPDFSSFCNINSQFNCDVVNSSRFSEVWGVPLALYGVGFYLAVLVLAGFSMGGSERSRRAPALIWGLSLLSVFLSAVLAWISGSAIGAWCVMCIALYGINAGLLATSWASLALPFGGMVKELDDELKGFFRSPLLFSAGAAFLGVVFIGSAAMPAPAGEVVKSGSGGAAQQAKDLGQATLDEYRNAPVVNVPLSGQEPFKGGANAAVVIVEFADFECPWCSKAADSLYKLSESMGDQVKIIYKHFPLDNSCNPLMNGSMHKDACGASIASICAGQQGQFWPMHKTLFSNQRDLGEADLVNYAQGLGLDMDAWNACRQGPEAAATLADDIRAAELIPVESTPTVLVNGRLIKGQAVVRPDLMELLVQDLLGAPQL